MGREPEYTVGDYWLARRPDGRSPYWQIRWYDPAAKTTRSISTGRERLEDAKDAIHAYVEAERSKGPQEPDEALVVAILKRFWDERVVPKVKNKVPFSTSYRAFMGFLMQDRIGIGAVVADLKAPVWQRFIDWRMNPHSYTASWAGKERTVDSKGVRGESVQRNLADIQAALEHAVRNNRLPFAPHVANIEPEDRSPPRDITLSMKDLGAIVGYALNDLGPLRWILAMLATGARPDAMLALDPARQYNAGKRLLDTQPPDWPRTKKRNAVVPVIEEFHPWLEAWAAHPHKLVKSRKRWWRNMRAALRLDAEIIPKVIRHTVATELRAMGVPQLDVEGLLGHQMSNRTTAVYAKYDPARLLAAKQGLSVIWGRVWAEALIWLSEHSRNTTQKGRVIILAREAAKC